MRGMEFAVEDDLFPLPYGHGSAHMHHANYNRRLSGPFHATQRGVNRAAVRADPAQSRRSRVALRNRVGGDQPEGAFWAQEIERAAIEMGNQVTVAVRVGMTVQQPCEVAVSAHAGNFAPSHERRIADDAIEPAP